MKSYTDIEQSKKLEEILPLESADMHYSKDFDGSWFVDLTEYTSVKIPKYVITIEEHLLPCWSLAALLGVLPTTIGNFFEKNALRLRMDKGENDFNIWYERFFDCGDVTEELDVKEDNPIDACYEMIIKLKEENLL